MKRMYDCYLASFKLSL